MRLHVLGIGSIGTLVSHHLRLANPDLPISLVVRSARTFPSTKLDAASPEGRQQQAVKLSVTRAGQTTTTDRFDLETYSRKERYAASPVDSDAPYGPISSLIVCLKTPNTLSALSQLKHRISPNSVVALLQNGMGVYDELCAKIWPEPATRPFFLLGTTTHGVTPSTTRGQVTHMSKAGEGDIKWGLVPDPRKEVDLEEWIYGRRVSDIPVLSAPSSPSLPLPPVPSSKTDLTKLHATVSALLSLDTLNSNLLPMPHIHHNLLLKLALNANINPLTAVLGAGSLPNGSLLGSSPSHRLIRMLSGETSRIIAAYLSNLNAPSVPPADVLRLYSRDNLISRTLALCSATARNSSSMAVDASAGRVTEIDYINGYLISLGDRLGLPTPHHQMVREMVKFTSEISGLKADTWPTDLKRVTMRQKWIAGAPPSKMVPPEPQSVISVKQRQYDEKKAKWALARERQKHRRHQAMRSKAQTVDAGTTSADASAERSEVDIKKADSNPSSAATDRDATLAHLEQLGLANRKQKLDTLASQQVEQSPIREQEEVDEVKNSTKLDGEQDEAVRAIEDRILSGFGGSRRRRF